ncbi:hypothetical protein [Novipirellula sp.]|uniref:hypothetical protein n=1 Tax=Novipirellula sp. TaxID=2795430 RepID=UPI0035619FD3
MHRIETCRFRWGEKGGPRTGTQFSVEKVGRYTETLSRKNEVRIQLHVLGVPEVKGAGLKVENYGTLEFSPQAAKKLAIALLREASESDSTVVSEAIKLLEN